MRRKWSLDTDKQAESKGRKTEPQPPCGLLWSTRSALDDSQGLWLQPGSWRSLHTCRLEAGPVPSGRLSLPEWTGASSGDPTPTFKRFRPSSELPRPPSLTSADVQMHVWGTSRMYPVAPTRQLLEAFPTVLSSTGEETLWSVARLTGFFALWNFEAFKNRRSVIKKIGNRMTVRQVSDIYLQFCGGERAEKIWQSSLYLPIPGSWHTYVLPQLLASHWGLWASRQHLQLPPQSVSL